MGKNIILNLGLSQNRGIITNLITMVISILSRSFKNLRMQEKHKILKLD